MKWTNLALLLPLIVLVAGCTQPSENNNQLPENTGNQTMFLPPEGSPYILIVNPYDGAVLRATSIGVKVNVTNFRLAGIVSGRPNAENEGHIHVTLDGTTKMSSINSVAFANVPKGDHTLVAELVNNDHTPLSPRAVSTVRFKTE